MAASGQPPGADQPGVVAPHRGWLEEVHRGAGDPPPPGEPVTLGDFTAMTFGTELRYVCLGDRELLRRVHVVVRDPSWGTIPVTREKIERTTRPYGTEVRADVEHVGGGLAFAWRGYVAGAGSALTYSMAGSCLDDFEFNRIGICVMLPLAEYHGAEYAAAGRASVIEGRLPDFIGPQLEVGGQYHGLFAPFERLSIRLRDGTDVSLAFTGDLFEIEDQRNWTDASFKIYSTPLAAPRPQRASRGMAMTQSLAVRVTPG